MLISQAGQITAYFFSFPSGRNTLGKENIAQNPVSDFK
jgi:hypothetical protein